MADIGIGVIGYGRIGAEHAAWIDAADGVTPIAVADPTPQRRARAEARGLRACERIESLLADDVVQAVLVSTPTAMHFEHALAALAAGRHVMIEKPMAMNLPQARRLVDEAAARRLVLSVFHNRRWDVDYLTVRQAAHRGVFGRLINVESRLGQWGSCVGPAAREWRPQWRNEAAFGGGGLYDWGPHFVDQLWRLMRPARPARVFAQLRGNLWASDCDDFARVCIDFDTGAAGLVEINTTTTYPLPRWHIDGSAGSAQSPASLDYDTAEWARLRFQPATGDSPVDLPAAPKGLTEPQIWSRFATAVRGEGKPAVTPASVLPTMALLDAAFRSARKGNAVTLAADLDWGEQ